MLDFGCCFGHDIRALVTDGAPAENLCGAEINATFLDLGFELFRDHESLKSSFYTANIFDENDKLREEIGRVRHDAYRVLPASFPIRRSEESGDGSCQAS